ncbi:MAG TPA: hypothetical protein VGX94_17925 [Terriglobia bacterium]|nr:hypothetical protein [Terriglobia bacterium]
MIKGRYLLIGALIFLLALLSAGCETMNPEWSGNMPNESGPHVQPQNLDAPSENNDAIRPLILMRVLRTQPSSTTFGQSESMKPINWRGTRTTSLRGLAGIASGPLVTGNAMGAAILPFKNARLIDGVALSANPAMP